MRYRVIDFFVLSLLVAPACLASADSASLPVIEVALGVYVHHGRHADIEDPAREDSANIGFVVGGDCVAVIDTGGSTATGNRLRAEIRKRTSRPICYVINTHVHFDHVLGNAAFAEDKPLFVGHRNLPSVMDASRDFFVQQFAKELGENPNGRQIISPGKLVEDQLDLDLGNRMLRLKAERPAHSDHDLTVLDLKTKTLWAGDLVFMERLPVLDGSLKGWLRWIDEALDDDYARVIPGHGPVQAPWPQAVAMLRDYLERLLAGAREAVANGQSLGEAMHSVAREATDGWVLTDRVHPRNVSKAYRELEWE